MVRLEAYRWPARIVGFALTLMLAFPLVFSEVEPAEAQSPVCFTVYGKCFCVDFFLTEVRDIAWGKVQDKIASLYQEFFVEQLDTQLQDILANIRHPGELLDWRTYSRQIESILSGRQTYDVGITPEDVQTDRSILDDSPHIAKYLRDHAHSTDNSIRPIVESIAYALASPESLLPYAPGQLNDANKSLSDAQVVLSKAWADRMVVSPEMDNIPNALSVAEMSSGELSRFYMTARMNAISAIAQQGLLAPVMRDAEIGGLKGQLSQIREIQKASHASVADVQSATILADALESETLLRRIESHLRQERLLGALIALKQEPALSPALSSQSGRAHQ